MSNETAPTRKNGRRPFVSVACLAVGLLGLFVLMAHDGQLPRGTLIGMLLTVLSAIGLLGVLRLRTEKDGAVPSAFAPGKPIFTSPLFASLAAAAFAVVGAIALGPTMFPYVACGALLLLLPASVGRPGLMVFVGVSAVYFPLLGTYGLWDPWETHYGEVAREILAKDDWISLWWAQDHWFWSKPILIFWTEAITMGALGVDYMPDANPLQPEWALRLPIYVMSMGALIMTYLAVKRVFGVRAGALSALVLATCPHFFFLAHQAITDIPFVANMTMAMACFSLALSYRNTEAPATFALPLPGNRKLLFTGQHVLLFVLTLIVLPQVMYLLTRNLTLGGESLIAWGRDQFEFGSGFNEGVPGNPENRMQGNAVRGWGAEPIVQGLVWLAAFAGLVFLVRRERLVSGLWMYGFYICCGLAFMGKGIPGFALPGLVALLFLIASKRWDLLIHGQFRVAAGILTVITVGLPWYVAMFIRHGPRFTDRLLVHDHINRLAAGVHGDNGSIEYFLEQLGFGMFPWIALVPASVGLWMWVKQRGDFESERQQNLLLVYGLWFFAAFTLFSAMVTKFHHYIFPAVPPAAVLCGLLLHRLWGETQNPLSVGKQLLATGMAMLAPVCFVIGVGGAWGDLRGHIPDSVTGVDIETWVVQNPESSVLVVASLLLGVVLAAGAWWLLRGEGTPERNPSLSVAVLAGSSIMFFAARDLSWITDGRPQGYERLIHLFVYNYERLWPDQFDYRPVLTGFAITAGVVFALAAFPVVRRVALRGMLGVSLAFAVWCLNVYMIDLSPHWGQKEIVKRYYEVRNGPEEPLIAFQMNWKGENFYTGNRVSVFVKLDTKHLKKWAKEHAGERIYAMMEHSRVNSFKNIVRGAEVEAISTKFENNKFGLLKVRLPSNMVARPVPKITPGAKKDKDIKRTNPP